MPKIERFEDVVAWQGARELVQAVYRVTAQAQFARDRDLQGQIRRASVSIMSNIAEGFERGTNKEFRHFLHVAKGSAGEVRSLLYVALDAGYLDAMQQQNLLDQIVRVSRHIGGFVRYLDSDLQQTANGKRTLRDDHTSFYAYANEP